MTQFTAGLAAQKHILRGLFTADGDVVDGSMEIRSLSLGLLSDVQTLLLGFGIRSSVKPGLSSHTLRVHESSLQAFAVHIGVLPGDLNCDGHVDFDDINPFVLALSDPAGYEAAYPGCHLLNADCCVFVQSTKERSAIPKSLLLTASGACRGHEQLRLSSCRQVQRERGLWTAVCFMRKV